MKEEYTAPYIEGDPDTTEQTEGRAAIIGPTTTSFPLNQGWYAKGQTPRTKNDSPRNLSSLTIHEITSILTKRLIAGAPDKDHRPHCEAEWRIRLTPREFPIIAWEKIWHSLRTPLSDATEEKNWQRLLHRAWDAKNRHPLNPDHTCRLKCKHPNEGMLHMLRCRKAHELWKACETFDKTVLQQTYHSSKREETMIFNTRNGHLIPETSRAFWRHAVGKYYAAATVVNKQNKVFSWQKTYYWTLTGLRDAALRRARNTRLLHINRTYTPLTNQIPQKEQTRFDLLITIHSDGTHTLNPTFVAAITAAKEAYEASLPKPTNTQPNAAHPTPLP